MRTALISMFLSGLYADSMIKNGVDGKVFIAHLDGFCFLFTLLFSVWTYKKEEEKGGEK